MSRIALSAAFLFFCAPVLAQPNANDLDADPAPQPALMPDTPLNGARYFLQQLADEREVGLSLAVAGARIGFIGGSEWDAARRQLFPFNIAGRLKIDSVNVEEQDEDKATVSVVAHWPRRDEGKAPPDEMTKKYTLQLRHEKNLDTVIFGPQANVWRVLPLSTEEVRAKPLQELPPFQLTATLALRDPLLLPLLQQLLRQQRGLGTLRQLGSATSLLLEDYNDHYAFDDAARERALGFYVEEDSLFTIPDTKDEKWHFNDNLSGKIRAELAEPARTVLFYDGEAPQSDKVHFRFGDKTLICFADGRSRALTKDELQDVIWKP